MERKFEEQDLLGYIANELREINKELQDIKLSTKENTMSLQQHMRRTEALEQFVESIHTRFDEAEKTILADKAINQYKKERLDFWVKILAGIGAISTVVYGYLKLKGIM